MKINIVVASINDLDNLSKFKNQFYESNHDIKLIVIDEGNKKIRETNAKILEGLNYRFYGSRERASWFRKRFNKNYKKYLSVIPEHCHAETSFGFLVAYEDGADVVIEIDDDVFPEKNYNLVDSHLQNLLDNRGVKVNSKHQWYNTLDSLLLNDESNGLFPRGHPYAPDARLINNSWKEDGEKCVLNMGLWTDNMDLDALTILYHGGIDGRCIVKGENLKKEKIVIGKNTYYAICSMNTAFLSKIIPAYYQLFMNNLGIDRFDDIWSGVFLKKIADDLDDNLCLGKPLVRHVKRPRSTFKDLRNELEGVVINESLWRIVNAMELDGDDYHSCYQKLINCLENNVNEFAEKIHRDFIKLQVQKMRLWLKVIEKIQ